MFSCYCALPFPQKPVLRWLKQVSHTDWSLNVSDSAKPHVLKFSAGATVRKRPVLKFTSSQIHSITASLSHLCTQQVLIMLLSLHFVMDLSSSPCTRLQQLHYVYGNVSCCWGIRKQRHLMKGLQQPWKSSTFVCFRSHYTIFFISFSFASGIYSLKNDLLFLQYLPCF